MTRLSRTYCCYTYPGFLQSEYIVSLVSNIHLICSTFNYVRQLILCPSILIDHMLPQLTALHVCLPRHSDYDAPRANKESNNGDDRSDQQLTDKRLRDSYALLHKCT
jgi:hypothetical protein